MDQPTDPTDVTLLDRFVQGDMRAYEILLQRYQKPVYNFVRRLVASPEETEDLTQEVFIRLFEKAAELQRGSSFRAWLWSIAANLCRDHFKSQRYRHHASLETPGVPQPISPPTQERALEEAEIGAQVEAAIRALKEEYRIALVLKEYQRLSYQDIAAAMNCPLGTVKSRLFAARKELQKRLAPLMRG
ncbi:MAG: sigma-70 family RNA polymerase sigma factor [Candidatus Latescibacteria bacterium]|nr:sigma-70 family RNA polymerase sigma factor [Candidatus Latescibacterota bacterium]